MASALAHFDPPTIDPKTAARDGVYVPALQNGEGKQEFWHFWFFPLLAAPLVTLAVSLGRSPILGFALFNVMLLLWALHRVCRRFGVWPALFLFISPVLWWADKAQVEVFTVALVALALTCAGELSLAALCCALAATQNPPLAAGAVFAAVLAVRQPHARGPSWAWWAAGVAAVLHPVYYLLQLGRLTPLASGGVLLPSAGLLLVPIVDLNMGLLWTAPLFAAVTIAAVAIAGLRMRRTLSVLGIAGLFLLFCFAQAANINSGGTPSLDRYALWLFPLTLPAVQIASSSRVIRMLIVASAVWSAVAFRPALEQSYLQPSRLAFAVWTRHPAWNNPPAEIFAERIRQRDGVHTVAATPGCEKVLITAGQWPTGCVAAPDVPGECLKAMCYANRQADGSRRYVTTARHPGYRID